MEKAFAPHDRPRPDQDRTLIEYVLDLSLEERFALNQVNAQMLVALRAANGIDDDRADAIRR